MSETQHTQEETTPTSPSPFLKDAFHFNLAEIIFIALMAALNVGFDIVVSPAVIALTTHLVAGIFIMLPVNFIFMYFTKASVDKFGTFSLYMTIFGAISAPLLFWGSTAGIWKIPLGFIIGFLLDVLFIYKNLPYRIIVGGIISGIIWWIVTFSVWQMMQLPTVKAMSMMLMAGSPLYNGHIDLSPFVTLPITSLDRNLIIFATLCGLLSAAPICIANYIGYVLYRKIKGTAVYARFKQYA